MRDRLIELIFESGILCRRCGEFSRNYCAEYIADYLLKNGAIVPSCKVGDTVYTIIRGKIFCYTVLEYGVRGKDGSVYAENGRDFLDFPFAELGKTVFLTREESERALKGGAE